MMKKLPALALTLSFAVLCGCAAPAAGPAIAEAPVQTEEIQKTPEPTPEPADLSALGQYAEAEPVTLTSVPDGTLTSAVLKDGSGTMVYLLDGEKAEPLSELSGEWQFIVLEASVPYPHVLFEARCDDGEEDAYGAYASALWVYIKESGVFTEFLPKPCTNPIMTDNPDPAREGTAFVLSGRTAGGDTLVPINLETGGMELDASIRLDRTLFLNTAATDATKSYPRLVPMLSSGADGIGVQITYDCPDGYCPTDYARYAFNIASGTAFAPDGTQISK